MWLRGFATQSKIRASRKGFTVLEVLIAFAILAIGFSACFALLAQGSARHNAAMDTATASTLASSVLDDVALNFFSTWRDTNTPPESLTGIPDIYEDLNRNGIEDGFESVGMLPAPFDRVPKAMGYDYRVSYHYSNETQREVLVYCVVTWGEGEWKREFTQRRIIFLKRDARPRLPPN